MNDLPGLGLPLRSTVTLWKKDRSIDANAVIAAISVELQSWYGAESEQMEAGLRAVLPLVRRGPISLNQWLHGDAFAEAKHIEVVISETDRAFHLTVNGRTRALTPVLATLGAYAIAAGLHVPSLIAPFIGVGAGLVAWAQAWWTFNLAVLALLHRSDVALGAGA